jgi:hypothetical protein
VTDLDIDAARTRRDAYRDAFARVLRASEPDSDRAEDLPDARAALFAAAVEAAADVWSLVDEVVRLRAALLEEQTVHAKTFDNFEAWVEADVERENDLKDQRDRLRREVEGLRQWRDGNHDEHRQLRDGMREVRRMLAAFDTPRDPGRVQAFVGDLRRITGAAEAARAET